MNTVTVQEMKEIERIADASGLPYYQMMENAGTRSYETIMSSYPTADSLFIFCGKGNNGGDGLVVARLAAENGIFACIILVEGEPVTKDALANYKKLPASVKILNVTDQNIKDLFKNYANPVIVDALYGTGFHGELRKDGRHACSLMNSLGAPIISLDLPSGCNADTKEVSVGAVTANITIVFHAYKNLHVPAIKNCGTCRLVDIGIKS